MLSSIINVGEQKQTQRTTLTVLMNIKYILRQYLICVHKDPRTTQGSLFIPQLLCEFKKNPFLFTFIFMGIF